MDVLGFICLLGLWVATGSEGRLVLFHEEKTVLQSRQTCESRGGQLAVLSTIGSQADLKSQQRVGKKGAWVGNLRTLEPLNFTISFPPNRTVMADSSRWECGYVTVTNVTMIGINHRLTASYQYNLGSKPCNASEDYLCFCQPYYGDRLLVKDGAAPWRYVMFTCGMHAKIYGSCGMWDPEPVPSGSLNVTMAGSVKDRYLRVNNTYWIKRVFRLTDVNATDDIHAWSRCGQLTNSSDKVQFRTCDGAAPFICDIEDSPGETTTDPSAYTGTTQVTNTTDTSRGPTTADTTHSNNTTSSGQGRQLSSLIGTICLHAGVAAVLHWSWRL